VETEEELDYLKREGCIEAQGYFFSKPKPVPEAYLSSLPNLRHVLLAARQTKVAAISGARGGAWPPIGAQEIKSSQG
jgi:predicted signal transduction protein with EAL and GGDEF domain